MIEVDLGKHIIAYLKKLNYKIYQEVDCGGRGIDVVGMNLTDKHIITVELKTSFNIKVIEQAYDNRLYSHFSYIAIPSAKYSGSRYFAIEVCRDYGIGVIEFVKRTGEVRELVAATKNWHPETLTIYEDKDSYSLAGSPDGKRWTPFKQTCVYITKYITDNPGCSINKMVDNIDHHYASKYSARSAIRNRIKSGVIKNIRISDNKLYIE